LDEGRIFEQRIPALAWLIGLNSTVPGLADFEFDNLDARPPQPG
jgi:hypothetical protein